MMRKRIFILLIALAFVSSCNNKPTESNAQSISKAEIPNSVAVAEMTLENTVSITVQDNDRQTLALGSGVIVAEGKVITNVHVIAGASYGYVQKTNSKDKLSIDGYFVIDKNNDIALLSVPGVETKNKISINTEFPKVGEKIYAAGNPQGLSGTFTEGNVSAIREIQSNYLIQISAPISPGSSGGAIVNSNGELIGIAVGGIEDGQNLNFAIPSRYIDTLLSANYSSVNQLDISKNSSSSKKEITNARELVTIKNIHWYYDCDNGNTPSVTIPPDNPLVEFSVYNNTSQPIYDISIVILIYDNDGLPVDYQSINTGWGGWYIGPIHPGLARKYQNIDCSYGDYLSYRERGHVLLSKKRGYKAVFRVLDYKIAKG